jgi:hypothetical protein
MPSPTHDFFLVSLADEIANKLREISQRNDEAGLFAAQIRGGGSSWILLREWAPDYTLERQPDGQFQHRQAVYPGVVFEVAYSQDGTCLGDLAYDYIQLSNGHIKVVIGINLGYRGEPSTVSLWRSVSMVQESEAERRVEVKTVIAAQVSPTQTSGGQG